MSARLVVVRCVLVLALAALAACGGGSGAGDPATSPSQDPEATELPCPGKARCFEFTNDSDGWPEVNDDQHFAGRDAYLDGSYRIGARESGSWSLRAPLRVGDLSQDYGVQIETDATLGQQFPPTAAWGATCWTRDLGDGRVAGFGAYVQPDVVTVGLYNQTSGVFQPLERHRADGLSEPGKRSHLVLRCTQDTSTGDAKARIEVELDGTAALTLSYANSVKNFGWAPADGVGLLVAGKDADVFYDHVVVTGR